jgi:ribosome maturation factor RimP
VAVTDIAKRVEQLLEPLAEQRGYDLVAVEQSGGRHTPVIRVLLDREGGIDIDAICEASRWIAEEMDAADPVPGHYTLEVSSPGVDRPLRKRGDFERFAGEAVTVKTKPAAGERSHWTGELIGIQGDMVVLEADGERVEVPFDSIVKARLKGVVSFNQERGTR